MFPLRIFQTVFWAMKPMNACPDSDTSIEILQVKCNNTSQTSYVKGFLAEANIQPDRFDSFDIVIA